MAPKTKALTLALCPGLATGSYSQLWGELEHYVEGKRVDILTPHYAVEVDWLHKWKEGVSQALEYARLTGKRPGLAIILEGEELDTEKFLECQRVCQEKRIRLWVVNNWVSVEDLPEVLVGEVAARHGFDP